MDSYQPIYDAVRSRISNGDIGSAVESVIRECNIGHYADMASRAVSDVAAVYDRPSAIYRPRLYIDGNKWCAIYGDDLQAGVAGFGESPSLAMEAFDAEWYRKLTANEAGGAL